MNIVIIEQNKIFRESLKTALDQIPDFKVVFDTDDINYMAHMNDVNVHLILIDYSLGKGKCNEIINNTLLEKPTVKFLLLINYKEEGNINCIRTFDIILKSSTKKDFEKKIREL